MAATAAARDPGDQLVNFRDMILNDRVALDKWQLVVVRLVTLPADQIRLSSQLRDHSHADAVLSTLQLWRSSGPERADLDHVFRDYGLVELADKCADIIQLLNPNPYERAQTVRGVNWKPVNLQLGTLYAITSKATGFVYNGTEPLDMWKRKHWFEVCELEEPSNSNVYELGTMKGGTFSYKTVRFTQVPGSHECFFIHPKECEDERAGLKYLSSRNDHLLKGNFAGLYEKSDGCGYDWDAFEFRFTPFVEYVKRLYNISAKMADFRFESTSESFVSAYNKGAGTIEEHSTINSVHGILFQTVTCAQRKESATINASDSISASARHFDSYGVNFEFKPSDVLVPLGHVSESPTYKFVGDWSSSLPVEVRRWSSAKSTGVPIAQMGWVENLRVEYEATVCVYVTDKFDGAPLDVERCHFILHKLGFAEEFVGVGEGGELEFATRGMMTASFPLMDCSKPVQIGKALTSLLL